MIIEMDERFRQCCTVDGSVLKYRRGKFGTGSIVRSIGMILIFAAIVSYLILAGVTLASGTEVSGRLNIYTSVFLATGIVLTFLGYRMRRQQEAGYVKYYADKNQVSESFIEGFDRECRESGAVLVIPEKNRKKAETQIAGVITKNYLLLPGMYGRVSKIGDMAAAFYDGDPKISGGKKLEPGFAYVTTDGLKHLVPLAEAYAKELVEETAKRNLAMYTKKTYITSDGRQINNFEETGPVIESYRRHVH